MIERREDKKSGMTIVTDQMKCKKCGKEFKCEWFEYVREEWLSSQFKLYKKKK
jgi:hypothetical protein